MALVFDTKSTYTNNTAFTTAQSFSHTVNGNSDRYIWDFISTEDFSTGGGAQTPSSVVYGGNALTLDGIITAGSVQTAAIYSGQDSVCGSSGAHNMVITYAGEVNCIVTTAISTYDMKQQAKEATGSTVSLNSSNTGGTSNITTASNGAVIMAACGNDAGGSRTVSWNVGTEIEDTSSTNVGGAFLRYELATAGAQAITATLSDTCTRFCMVSFSYAIISNTDPVLTVPGAQRYLVGVAEVISGISFTDPDDDESVMTFTCNQGTFAAPTPTNVDVSGSGTATMTLTGTRTELNAYCAAGNGPTYTHTTDNHTADTITVNIDDQVGTPDEETIAVTPIDWRVTANTMADLNAVLAGLKVTEETAKTVLMTVYAEDDGDRTDSSVVTITVTETVDTFSSCVWRRRRKS